MAYSLEEIAARMEISDMIARYTHALDRREWDKLDTVFAPDAIIDLTASGGIRDTYPVVKDWWPGAMAKFVMMQHYFTNLEIRFAEGYSSARMRSQVLNPLKQIVDGKGHKFFVGGTYDDRLAARPEGWRIVRRVWTINWVAGDIPANTSL